MYLYSQRLVKISEKNKAGKADKLEATVKIKKKNNGGLDWGLLILVVRSG